MLRLLLFIVPVLSQDILGVYYSFDEDYYQTFNDKKCVDELPWHVNTYESIGIPKPSEKSATALVASGNSCGSSFPIILLPNSTLEFTVYMNTVAKYSGLIISIVHKESDTAVASRYYNRSSDGFKAGWSIIQLKIEENGVYYINLRGHSRDDEIILVDSFRFLPNHAKIEEDQETVDEILKFVPKNTKLSNELDEDDYEGSADDGSGDNASGENEEPVIIPEPEPRLGLLSIVLISVGAITIVVLVGVGAYQCGKAKGLEASNMFDVNAEPPRVYNIPRVKGVTNILDLNRTT